MNALLLAGPAVAIVIATLLTWLLPPSASAVVLAVVIACVVVPHGALDALSLREPRQWVAYVATAGMVIVGWWIAPVISLVVFFIVTGVHFAQGDAAFILDGESKALRAAARGILPLSLPGAFHPQEYVSAITLVLESLQSSSASLAVYVVPLSWIGTAIAAAATLWSWRKGAGLDDLRELTGLVLLFAIATPLLAIGLYLALWHGWRHGLRISQLRTGRATIGGLVEAMRASGVTIAVSVFGFLAVIGAFAASGAPLPSVLGPTIAFLAALTVPHVAVVTLLDRGCADAGPRIKAPGGR